MRNGDNKMSMYSEHELLSLITYIENKCRESGTYEGCLKVISLIKARIEELATNGLIHKLLTK